MICKYGVPPDNSPFDWDLMKHQAKIKSQRIFLIGNRSVGWWIDRLSEIAPQDIEMVQIMVERFSKMPKAIEPEPNDS